MHLGVHNNHVFQEVYDIELLENSLFTIFYQSLKPSLSFALNAFAAAKHVAHGLTTGYSKGPEASEPRHCHAFVRVINFHVLLLIILYSWIKLEDTCEVKSSHLVGKKSGDD